MPPFDATATTHLDTKAVTKPAFYVWLDILGDPVRATTAGHDVTLTGTGDAELDGSYLGIDPQVVEIGEVVHQDRGSNTVIASLSGLLLPDADLLATIGDRANWQGRVARMWMQVRDETETGQGAIVPYYTGFMSSLELHPSPESQTIQLEIENYLVSLTEASNRTWLSQGRYDSGDTSAAASISSANNARTGQGAASGGGAGGGSVRNKLGYDYNESYR